MTNFGFTGETHIELVGTNAKMSEVHALFGLATLAELDDAIKIRTDLMNEYRKCLSALSEIEFLPGQSGVVSNGQYFPIFLKGQRERDALYESLKCKQILARKYFYPLVNQFAPYREKHGKPFPVADSWSARVLCLPIHNLLTAEHVKYICDQIRAQLTSVHQ
jgi:dTDP-4-amino-4,6-dideoxygalactose transaminase